MTLHIRILTTALLLLFVYIPSNAQVLHFGKWTYIHLTLDTTSLPGHESSTDEFALTGFEPGAIYVIDSLHVIANYSKVFGNPFGRHSEENIYIRSTDGGLSWNRETFNDMYARPFLGCQLFSTPDSYLFAATLSTTTGLL
jgi:hypothetical protein